MESVDVPNHFRTCPLKDSSGKMFIDDIIHDLEAHDFNSLLYSQKQEFIEELKKIRDWPEPKPGAGEGLGPLAGMGMYLQYESDSKKHKEEIDAIISKLEKHGKESK